jgi:outer membrane lipoprotein SlyB
VKRIEKEIPARTEQESPAGIVASVPLGGGPVAAGSVMDVRREQQTPAVNFEIVVRLDDGRFQLVRQDDSHGLREGDKVRIDAGKVVLRSR